jgi:hypothetical protein
VEVFQGCRLQLAEFIPRAPSRNRTDASGVDARREGQPKPNSPILRQEDDFVNRICSRKSPR